MLYSLIDQKGQRIGIPVKASVIPGKPTLAFLEKQFRLNQVLRQPRKEQLRKSIEQVLTASRVVTRDHFKNALDKKGIVVLFRTNTEGKTYGVTFIDNRTQVIFNGSDLGKSFSANAILQRLSAKEDAIRPYRPGYTQLPDAGLPGVLKDLISADDTMAISPEAALRLGRKKRRKGKRI